MSTRGWYEYYVLDEQNVSRTLSLKFYKWGDAVPIEALAEWSYLQKKLQENAYRLPVELLDEMLREQLNALYESLPPHFSVAVFLFMLQRANEERLPLRHYHFNELPTEQRPDYQLGLALGKAMALNGFKLSNYEDSALNDVVRYIAVGRFIRPWKYYGLTWPVLKWLQYLTQITATIEMGSIAGRLDMEWWNINYSYRIFIWINSSDAFKVDRLAIELCDSRGTNLFDLEEDQVGKEGLKKRIEQLNVDMYSLAQAEKDFTPTEDLFWGPECYERL